MVADRPSMMPADTPDTMAPAWSACMQWALNNSSIRDAFEADTGLRYSPPAGIVDAMIDEVTGHGAAYVRAFVEWANVNVWGPMDAEVSDG